MNLDTSMIHIRVHGRPGTNIQHSFVLLTANAYVNCINTISWHQFMKIIRQNIGSWETQFAAQPSSLNNLAFQQIGIAKRNGWPFSYRRFQAPDGF